jgi:hypothetical protein
MTVWVLVYLVCAGMSASDCIATASGHAFTSPAECEAALAIAAETMRGHKVHAALVCTQTQVARAV